MNFRTKDAAEYLNVAASTLEAWRHRGGGPVFLKFGKAVRYRQSDLEDFIKSKLRKNTSGTAELLALSGGNQ